MSNKYQCDIAVIGGGLAGLVTAIELLDHDKKVLILERDKQEKFGGLEKESFGGIMMVGTPHQKKWASKIRPNWLFPIGTALPGSITRITGPGNGQRFM